MPCRASQLSMAIFFSSSSSSLSSPPKSLNLLAGHMNTSRQREGRQELWDLPFHTNDHRGPQFPMPAGWQLSPNGKQAGQLQPSHVHTFIRARMLVSYLLPHFSPTKPCISYTWRPHGVAAMAFATIAPILVCKLTFGATSLG